MKLFSTDEELMTEVKMGDLDALSPIFEKYHVKIYNFFLRQNNDRETSRDLTQNVFSRILKYRHTYDEKQNFKTWIYEIARNIHFDHYRQNHYFTTSYDDSQQPGTRDKDALDEMAETEKREMLAEAIGQLPADQRELIELSRFQGLKYEEISEITGSSVPAIKVKIHRAMKRLKEVYFEMA